MNSIKFIRLKEEYPALLKTTDPEYENNFHVLPQIIEKGECIEIVTNLNFFKKSENRSHVSCVHVHDIKMNIYGDVLLLLKDFYYESKQKIKNLDYKQIYQTDFLSGCETEISNIKTVFIPYNKIEIDKRFETWPHRIFRNFIHGTDIIKVIYSFKPFA